MVQSMADGNLATTNLLLGIMAAVSLFEAILIIALGVMAWRLFARVNRTLQEIEQRQIAPLTARVNLLMDRVDEVLNEANQLRSRVADHLRHLDSTVRSAAGHAGATLSRTRRGLATPIGHLVGAARGARVAWESFFVDRHDGGAPYRHAGQQAGDRPGGADARG
jgi:hypothetical protein